MLPTCRTTTVHLHNHRCPPAPWLDTASMHPRMLIFRQTADGKKRGRGENLG
jgi:hypothetical protein